MQGLGLDCQKEENFEKLANMLGSAGFKEENIEDVSTQSALVKQLSSLLSHYKLLQPGFNDNLFIFPGREEFLVKLLENLDSTLESQAGELFLSGCKYVAGFIGTHKAQHVIRRLLEVIKKRFPDILAEHDQQYNNFIDVFFTKTVGEFLNENNNILKEFQREFSFVYELFVEPLTASSTYRDRKLYCYYCNPYIFRPIMELLSTKGGNVELAKKPILWLEELLQGIHPYTNEESWSELTNKACNLHNTSKELEPFMDACSGVLGEVKAAFLLTSHECQQGDILIFLKDQNSNRKKKGQSCDLMVICSKSQKRALVEVKAKSPRHGVLETNSDVWGDFFTNYGDSIFSYFSYLDTEALSISGLNLKKSFPLLCIYEGCNYGTVPSFVKQVEVDENPNASSKDKPKCIVKIKALLRGLYLQPVTLDSRPVPLASEHDRLSTRRKLTQDVLHKDWARNLMKKGFEQLKKTAERQRDEGHEVSKLYFVLDLSLSFRLLQDPLSFNDGDVRSFANEKLHEIFQQFRDQARKEGFKFELLLP